VPSDRCYAIFFLGSSLDTTVNIKLIKIDGNLYELTYGNNKVLTILVILLYSSRQSVTKAANGRLKLLHLVLVFSLH